MNSDKPVHGLRDRILWCLYASVVISCFASGQQQEKLVILNHADSLVGVQIDGEEARKLIGNVKFTQGSVVVTCDRAVQFLKRNTAEMDGHILVHDDSVRLYGNKGRYDGALRQATAYDSVTLEDRNTRVRAAYGEYLFPSRRAYFLTDVIVEDTATTLTAGELTYFRDQERSIANNDVRITNKDSSVTLFGNHFESDRKNSYSKMTESPKLLQIERTAGGATDTLVVTSTLMESFRDSLERLVATDNVILTRHGFSAVAGFSEFYTALDSIILRKNPIVWYTPAPHDEHQVSGDSIFINLVKRKLHTVYVRGSAFAISRADSLFADRFNQLSGQELIMGFDRDKIQQIDVDRTATSLYYLFDGKQGNGMNKTSGDHITFSFIDGKMDRIKVIGGVEGQYYPENMINHQESSYNLSGFNWREKRPSHNR